MRVTPIVVLGTQVGTSALSSIHTALLADAQLVAGGADLLDALAAHCDPTATLLPLRVPLAPVLDALCAAWQAGQRVVVLADGDPLYFGIGATLSRKLPPHALRIVPGISSMQTACARLGLSWDGVRSVSLHGRDHWLALAHAVRQGGPVCVLGDAAHGPAVISAWLLERGADWLHMHLFTSLNTDQECHTELTLPQATARTPHPADNAPTMLLTQDPQFAHGPSLTLDADLPCTDGALLTKGPVRAAALASLCIQPHHTVWDIGAGSGSVAFGAAALAWQGSVWAVERHPQRVPMLHANRRHLAALHVEIVAAQAPFGLEHLPDPDAIFVGGGLGAHADSEPLLTTLHARLRPGGRLTVACVLFSSLERVRQWARQAQLKAQLRLIQAADSVPLADDVRLAAHNPVFLATIIKAV